MSALQRVALSSDALRAVAHGHPWVYDSGLKERFPAGTPLLLVDPRGRSVGFALADDGEIAARVLARHPGDLGRIVEARIHAAATLRRRVLPPDTDAYRLINGAGDGLPGVVVDRYGPAAVVRLYGACWVPHLPLLVRVLEATDDVEHVVRRLGVRRVDGREGLDHLAGSPCPDTLVVKEAGLRFLVRPAQGQKTGLFLDQREHRRTVASMARGLELVNLFGYTGGFSVHAAAAGARRVITVDIAPDAIEDARENFRLNGLRPEDHGFEVADAFAWSPERPVDFVVSDPPSLTHGRRSDSAARVAYRDLATHTGRMVAPGGLLATASCTARLSWQRWEEAVAEGLRKAGRWSWLWQAREPADHPVAMAHPEGHYLKFSVLGRHDTAGPST